MSRFRYFFISLLIITISFSFMAIYRLNIPNKISFLWYSDFYNDFSNEERNNENLDYQSFDVENIKVALIDDKDKLGQEELQFLDRIDGLNFETKKNLYLVAYIEEDENISTILKFDEVVKRGKDIFIKLCINNQSENTEVQSENKSKKNKKKKMYYDIISFPRSSIGSDGQYELNVKDQKGFDIYNNTIYLNVNM